MFVKSATKLLYSDPSHAVSNRDSFNDIVCTYASYFFVDGQYVRKLPCPAHPISADGVRYGCCR